MLCMWEVAPESMTQPEFWSAIWFKAAMRPACSHIGEGVGGAAKLACGCAPRRPWLRLPWAPYCQPPGLGPCCQPPPEGAPPWEVYGL